MVLEGKKRTCVCVVGRGVEKSSTRRSREEEEKEEKEEEEEDEDDEEENICSMSR